eukprot:105752-Pelagomonas_calceolata.AAC.1
MSLLALLTSVLSKMVAVQAQTPLPDASEFILKQGGQLVHKGRPFYFAASSVPSLSEAGANAYQLFDDAVWDDKKHLPSILLGRAEASASAAAVPYEG